MLTIPFILHTILNYKFEITLSVYYAFMKFGMEKL